MIKKINLIHLASLLLLLAPQAFAQKSSTTFNEMFNCDPIEHTIEGEKDVFTLTMFGEFNLAANTNDEFIPNLTHSIASVSMSSEKESYPVRQLFTGSFSKTSGKIHFKSENARYRIELMAPDHETNQLSHIKTQINIGTISHPEWVKFLDADTVCHFSHQQGGGSVGGSNKN